MSGIAGIVNFDGAPASPEAIRMMLDAQAYRGPDKRGVWAEGSVGLGHDLLRTVPEAEHETQPFSLDQSVWITADGRLDNRGDLIRALRHASSKPLDGVPDCHLMLLAFHHWGEEFAAHLIGDFALAIWDGHSRRLLCAVDALAIRSLYYTVTGQQFIFGSSIGAVLAVLSEQPAPNEVSIAQFLTGSLLDGRTATFYGGIQRLAPCHLLIADDGRILQRKYFEFGIGELIRYGSDQEYIDHFRELLEQSLNSCLRSNTGISIQVSGGLDSSSLAVLANHLVTTGKFRSSHSLTASCMVTREYREMDESAFQDAVVKHSRYLTPDYLCTDSFWALKSFGTDGGYPFHQPEPHATRAAILAVCDRVRERQERVMIAGIGSDNVNGRIGGYSAYGPLRDLSWRDKFAEWRYFRRHNSTRSLLFNGYVRPLLSPLVRGRLRGLRYAHQTRRSYPYVSPGWLASRFRGRAIDQKSFEPALPTRAGRLAYNSVMDGWECLWYSCTDTAVSYSQIELRHPYLDRRLIDYMLRIPTRLLVRGGWDKWILREAIGHLLPDSARFRRNGAIATAQISRGLREMERRRIEALISDSQLVRRGWVQATAWQRAWEDYWNGTDDSYPELVAGISVEAWLRAYT